MTKREAERLTHQENTLLSLGFTRDEAAALRRISRTLQRWFEYECGDGNGCIERDETTGRPLWRNANTGRAYPIPDSETGARKRLETIIAARNQRVRDAHAIGWPIVTVSAYVQTDPRGAALYIIRRGDVPEGEDIASYYTRGVCVY